MDQVMEIDAGAFEGFDSAEDAEFFLHNENTVCHCAACERTRQKEKNDG